MLCSSMVDVLLILWDTRYFMVGVLLILWILIVSTVDMRLMLWDSKYFSPLYTACTACTWYLHRSIWLNTQYFNFQICYIGFGFGFVLPISFVLVIFLPFQIWVPSCCFLFSGTLMCVAGPMTSEYCYSNAWPSKTFSILLIVFSLVVSYLSR